MQKSDYFISFVLSVQNEVGKQPITFSCIKDIDKNWAMPSLEVTENGLTESWDDPTFLLTLKQAVDFCDYSAIADYGEGINVKSFVQENLAPLTYLFNQLDDLGFDFEVFLND